MGEASAEFTDFHTTFFGFESALHNLCSDVYTYISSTARIAIPFSVQFNIGSSHNIGYKDDSSRMVYIDLHAIVEDYATMEKSSSFEILE